MASTASVKGRMYRDDERLIRARFDKLLTGRGFEQLLKSWREHRRAKREEKASLDIEPLLLDARDARPTTDGRLVDAEPLFLRFFVSQKVCRVCRKNSF